jgi:conjugative transposon TraK protein
MFSKTKNLETAFQHVRLVAIVYLIACFGVSGLIAWQCFRMVQKERERIYVLSCGKVLEAFASDRKENLPAEARDHIRAFHQYFFSLSPDEKAIEANLTHALYLADASAKQVYDNLKESGYYAGIISGNIIQEIDVDSIRLEMTTYPFHFWCHATQRISRASSIVTRLLITEGWLRNTGRSDNNPHGFLIERWKTLKYKDLQVVPR